MNLSTIIPSEGQQETPEPKKARGIIEKNWTQAHEDEDSNPTLPDLKDTETTRAGTSTQAKAGTTIISQGLLGLCCLIETRDHIEIITITAVFV